jgi:hypothetical protein
MQSTATRPHGHSTSCCGETCHTRVLRVLVLCQNTVYPWIGVMLLQYSCTVKQYNSTHDAWWLWGCAACCRPQQDIRCSRYFAVVYRYGFTVQLYSYSRTYYMWRYKQKLRLAHGRRGLGLCMCGLGFLRPTVPVRTATASASPHHRWITAITAAGSSSQPATSG